MDVLLRNLAFFNLKAMGYLQKQCKLSTFQDLTWLDQDPLLDRTKVSIIEEIHF
jgi:hypothetical protein